MHIAKAAIVDFALIGSSLKAGIIAGLLAKEHKKRVCLVIGRARQYQLAHSFNLSFDCATRPETWQMLSALYSESTKLVTLIEGRRSLLRINPLIVCHTRASHNALAHMYHVARGYGYEMERLGNFPVPGTNAGFRFRDARVLRHDILWPKMLKWLEKNGVQIIEPSSARLLFNRDGTGHINNGESEITAGCVVLADQEAVLQHGGKQDVERFFITCKATSLLSGPLATFSDQFILSPEHKFAAFGQKKGRMEFSALVGPREMPALIKANIALEKNIRRTGQSMFDTTVPRDGAPVVGKLARSNFWVLSGFGYAGVYFAPALARLLVDKCSQNERDYFTPRSANSRRKSNEVAEFQHITAKEK